MKSSMSRYVDVEQQYAERVKELAQPLIQFLKINRAKTLESMQDNFYDKTASTFAVVDQDDPSSVMIAAYGDDFQSLLACLISSTFISFAPESKGLHPFIWNFVAARIVDMVTGFMAPGIMPIANEVSEVTDELMHADASGEEVDPNKAMLDMLAAITGLDVSEIETIVSDEPSGDDVEG